MPNFEEVIERVSDPKWRRRLYTFKRVFDRLLPLGGMSDGNQLEVFTEEDQIFEQMLLAIKQATKRIWLETYILEPDLVGLKFRQALQKAAARGCEVILIYDHFGSANLHRGFLDPLIRSGARVLSYNPIWPWRRRGPLLFRDHRKILLIDEDMAFCGSINICLNSQMRFRDTVVKVCGPASLELEKLFLDTLHETTGETKKAIGEPKLKTPGVLAQVLASNQRRKLHSIQKSMELTLNRAQRYCYLTTPYFLPYPNLKKAMIEASKRGVDVRVLTAGISDVPLMRLASRHVYAQFLESGIRIYELYQQTLHAKTAVIDGVYGWVGSYNLDHWSARRNLEVNLGVIDPQFALQLESHFETDLKLAQEISWPSWQKRGLLSRFLPWLAYQVMRL